MTDKEPTDEEYAIAKEIWGDFQHPTCCPSCSDTWRQAQKRLAEQKYTEKLAAEDLRTFHGLDVETAVTAEVLNNQVESAPTRFSWKLELPDE